MKGQTVPSSRWFGFGFGYSVAVAVALTVAGWHLDRVQLAELGWWLVGVLVLFFGLALGRTLLLVAEGRADGK